MNLETNCHLCGVPYTGEMCSNGHGSAFYARMRRESVARLAVCECGEACFERGNGRANLCEDCAYRAMEEAQDGLRAIVERVDEYGPRDGRGFQGVRDALRRARLTLGLVSVDGAESEA